jgi:solute carrier family 13 (sodium-dependent dicarboxylate transporter), member 2/3/5
MLNNTKLKTILIGPFVFLFLFLFSFLFPTHASLLSVLGLAFWIIFWWTTESIPIAATSFLPLLILPILGVSPFLEIIPNYYSSIILLFWGGFVLGLSLEKYKIHEIIALEILKRAGKTPAAVIGGVMYASYFISMWISNTATAIMMLPIAVSIFNLVDELSPREVSKKIAIGSMLGIAYGANIGGIATIIGTPPNMVLKSFLEDRFGSSPDFMEWMLVGLPFSLILIWIANRLFTKVLFVLPSQPIKGLEEFIESRKKAIGPLSKVQIRSMLVFASAAFCWIFQGPINFILNHLQIDFKLSDAGIAVFFALLTFLIPQGTPLKTGGLMHWKDMKKIAWPILFMFGGGMSLALGLEKAGFVQVIQEASSSIPIAYWAMVAIFLILISVFATEIMSNVALITILIPVVVAISASFGITNPLVLGIPVTFGSSLAFMLPISTPPNAVVYSSKLVSLKTMVKTGFWLNVVSIVLLTLLFFLLKLFYV